MEADPIIDDIPHAQRVAEMMKVLGHPTRLRLVAALCRKDQFVGALAEELGLAQSETSQHLRILRLNGLVVATRGGGRAVYRLGEPRLRDLVRCVGGCALR